MIYEVGQKVKIKDICDLEECDDCANEMIEFAGQAVTITGGESNFEFGYSYKIDIDNGEWYWHHEMIEGEIE